jgi:nucleotide-binding universal stress UspA family protein
MFNKILVPLDRSALAECVLPHAIALARALDSQLILLHVLSVSDKPDRLRAVDPLEWHYWQRPATHGVCSTPGGRFRVRPR